MITAEEIKQRINSLDNQELKTTLMLLVQLREDVEANDNDIISATKLALATLENRLNAIESRVQALEGTT